MSSKKNIVEMQAELDNILNWFNSSEVNVDEVDAMYKKAMSLAAEIKKQLKIKENNIVKIKNKFEMDDE